MLLTVTPPSLRPPSTRKGITDVISLALGFVTILKCKDKKQCNQKLTLNSCYGELGVGREVSANLVAPARVPHSCSIPRAPQRCFWGVGGRGASLWEQPSQEIFPAMCTFPHSLSVLPPRLGFGSGASCWQCGAGSHPAQLWCQRYRSHLRLHLIPRDK